jgi:SAM-dependent methyltransferase
MAFARSRSATPPAPANPRLHPRRTDTRYFGLVALRDAITEAVQRHVRPLSQARGPLTAVDLGCGTAPYRPLFADCLDRYVAADLAHNPAADVAIDPASGQVALGDASADLVISTQVLEHVESPRHYLDEARRLCRPGGLLLLSTHGYWKYHPDPTDYWRWTGAGLCKLLGEQRWDVIDRIGILGFAAAAAGLLQDAVASKLPRPLRKPTAVVMQQAVGLLDRLYTPQTRTENAALYLVVARPRAASEARAA